MDDFVKERLEWYSEKLKKQRSMMQNLHLLKLRENHEIKMATNPRYRKQFREKQKIKYHVKKLEYQEQKDELKQLRDLVDEYEQIIKEQQDLIEDLYHDLGV